MAAGAAGGACDAFQIVTTTALVTPASLVTPAKAGVQLLPLGILNTQNRSPAFAGTAAADGWSRTAREPRLFQSSSVTIRRPSAA